MSLIGKKTRLKKFLIIYLILAITGSFAFTLGEFLCSTGSGTDNMGSGRFFSSISHTIDWLAEDSPAISKANRYSNNSMNTGMLRVFVFAGLFGITMILTKSKIKININNNFLNRKNNIPLKLRI